MSDWVDVGRFDSFVPGEKQLFNLDDTTRLIVVRLDESVYAIEDLCTHDYLSMEGGDVEGDQIVCPYHGARFCLKTGEVTAPPAYENVTTFPVRIENEVVQIRDPRWD